MIAVRSYSSTSLLYDVNVGCIWPVDERFNWKQIRCVADAAVELSRTHPGCENKGVCDRHTAFTDETSAVCGVATANTSRPTSQRKYVT